MEPASPGRATDPELDAALTRAIRQLIADAIVASADEASAGEAAGGSAEAPAA